MNFLIGLLAAVSVATWLYTRQMRSTGGNTKSSLIGAGVAGVIVLFLVWSVAVMVDSSL